MLNSSLTSCQGLCHQPSQREDSKVIWQYNHSKSLNNVPKGPDNLTMTLSAAVSHIKYRITPLSSSAAYLGMGSAVSILIPDKNPAHWGDTVQSVFPLCQADKPNYRGKIPWISPRSSLLSTVSCTSSVPQERNSIDFPDSQVWTQNMSQSFVSTHWNSNSVTFRVIAL